MLRDVFFLCVNLNQVKGYVEGCVFLCVNLNQVKGYVEGCVFVCQLDPS